MEGREPVKETSYLLAMEVCSAARRVDETFAIAEKMAERQIALSCPSFNVLIQACERVRKPQAALVVYERMKKEGVEPNILTYVYLLKALVSSGRMIKEAEEVFAEMERAGFYGDRKLFGTLVEMCRKRGDAQFVWLIYQMGERHKGLDRMSKNTIMNILGKVG